MSSPTHDTHGIVGAPASGVSHWCSTLVSCHPAPRRPAKQEVHNTKYIRPLSMSSVHTYLVHIDLNFWSPCFLLPACHSLNIWPCCNMVIHPATLGRTRYDGREAASSSTSSRCRTLGSDCSVSGGSLGRRSRGLSASSYCHISMIAQAPRRGIIPCPDSNCFRLYPNQPNESSS